MCPIKKYFPSRSGVGQGCLFAYPARRFGAGVCCNRALVTVARVASIRRSENGAAALLLIGGIAVLISCLGALAAAVGLAGQSRLQSRAESFALVAADTASGRIPGYPCENVKSLANAEHVNLASCQISGLESRVVLSGTAGPMRLTARAHAGPRKIVSNLTSR